MTAPERPTPAPPRPAPDDYEICAKCGFTFSGHVGNTGCIYPCWTPSGVLKPRPEPSPESNAPPLCDSVIEWDGAGAIRCRLDRGHDGRHSPSSAAPPLGEATGCPCTLVTPCSNQCSCADPVMSGGCRRCARYGSLEQRKAAASRLSALQAENERYREELEEIAHYPSYPIDPRDAFLEVMGRVNRLLAALSEARLG